MNDEAARSFATADLSDEHPHVVIAEPLFRDFGGRIAFAGPIATVRALEDNSLVRTALEEPGEGRVLVVDGSGSTRCAMLGDRLAQLGCDNGWSGAILHAAVRDTAVLATIEFGVKALAAHPRKSVKRGAGERDISLRFAGVEFHPGHWVYADADGILVAASPLL